METDITFSYFATSSTVHFNSSEIIIIPTNGEDKFKWTVAEIARLFHIIVRPILVIFGTVGNVLTVYIMRATSLKKISSCFYMVVLALVDTRKWTFYYIINLC